MPFTSQEITDAGKLAIDFYMKNKPIDQVAVERPLMKMLMDKKKTFPGAKQYVVEQLRYRYQSNFQWFNGSSVVTYNKRITNEQAQYPWRSAHDGFALDEDRLAQNGIMMIEGKSGNASESERIQLTNLMEEQTEALRLGFEEKFSAYLHLDGTLSTDAIGGLDLLISTNPSAAGTVGGIDQAANSYWRNNVSTGITVTATTGNILTQMEIMWRGCIKNGGRPNFIVAGSTFMDGFRDFMLNTYGRIEYMGGGERTFEGGTKELTFHGVPIIWSPEFDDSFGGLVAPAIPWAKRCYFLNSEFIKLRPMDGQDMVTRKPPRVYNQYTYFWAMTWRGAMTTCRRNAHAMMSIV